jgi:starch-binding outer membrane protein, SusD/RagB family
MKTNRFWSGTGRKALPLMLAAVLPLAACDTDALLEVDEPSYATPESLRNLAGLPVLYAGALGDFQVGMSGADLADAFLSNVALFTDELRSSDTFTTRNATDQRNSFPAVQGNTSDLAYHQLHYARRSLAETAEIFEEVLGNTTDHRYARMKALEGLTIVGLAEAFCGAVPLGEARAGVVVSDGQPLTTNQLYEQAIIRFDAAIASVGSQTSADHVVALRIARVGKARALLGLGRYADAATAIGGVAGVPTNFIYFIEHSSNLTRQRNPLFALQDNRRYTVSDSEGGTGMPFRSANDLRVPSRQIAGASASVGFDNSTPLFRNGRYREFGANVPIADGIQARLVEAEASLHAGTGAWLTILNELRAEARALMTARYGAGSVDSLVYVQARNDLPPLVDPGTQAARIDLLFRERAFWLYMTGTRMGDMRRLVRVYGRNAETVFPTGAWHKGGTYGADVNFPIPFNEVFNPNFDHSMCVTTQA